jgi:hypothetical protein
MKNISWSNVAPYLLRLPSLLWRAARDEWDETCYVREHNYSAADLAILKIIAAELRVNDPWSNLFKKCE